MIKNLILFIKEKRKGIPYFIEHGIFAVILHLIVLIITGNNLAGAMLGFGFYLGREVRDYQKLNFFDENGFLYPTGFVTILFCLVELIKTMIN